MEERGHQQPPKSTNTKHNPNFQRSPFSLRRTVNDDVVSGDMNVGDCIDRTCEKIGRKLEKLSKVIDDKRFEASLDKFLPRPSSYDTPVRKRLREAEFRQLAEFCNRAGHPQWALRPRTFAVLRMIGRPEFIENFIEEKLTDIFLPYSESNLPSFLSGRTRRFFLDCQNFVLNGRAQALEKPGEAHQHVEGSADAYFVYVEDLGAGGFGEVDSVIGEMSLRKFARKRIARNRLFSKDKAQLQVFENELQTLKMLSHRHLVQLVGSYTDSACVGLIMTPVADMNLATYLKRTSQPESKKICLRRFFGCLANALNYLHSQHVQHKDIKPANILVKQQEVYLTDFGTSRSWDNDASKTTRGTVPAFTPRYCAPEVVQFGSSRNESRDIWSLGCVFLEMCCILADQQIEDMLTFLRSNGTCAEYIRENEPGTNLWADRLRSTLAISQDRQPLELALQMCTHDPHERPLASELVALISEFEQPPRYYGLCCGDDFSGHTESQISDSQPLTNTVASPSTDKNVNENSLVNDFWRSNSFYQPPSVDDPTEELTVRAFFPPGGTARKYIIEDIEETEHDSDNSPRDLLENPTPRNSISASSSTLTRKAALIEEKSEAPADQDQLRIVSTSKVLDGTPKNQSVLQILNSLAQNDLPCPSPICSRQSHFQSCEELFTHVREVHGIHELFWTSLLQREFAASVAEDKAWMPGQIISGIESSNLERSFVVKRDVVLSSPSSDPFAEQLKSQYGESKKKFAKAKPSVPHQANLPPIDQYDQVHADNLSAEQKFKENDAFFSLLPHDKRPEPIRPRVNESENIGDEDLIISPDPLPEPLLLSDTDSAGLSMPQSSSVPSYILTLTNYISPKALKTEIASQRLDAKPPPLFVYGSLMLPSVLRARAAKFISAEGVYSQKLQRRLQTSAEDWAHINETLQQAAQQMTPALLKGYRRVEVGDFKDAALIGSKLRFPSWDNPTSKPTSQTQSMEIRTNGFIIFGLSHEAFACLDFLFCHEGRIELDNPKPFKNDPDNKPTSDKTQENSDSGSDNENESNANDIYVFERKRVDAFICTSDRSLQKVRAMTYVLPNLNPDAFESWSLNRFVKCKSFRRFSTNTAPNDYDWVAEEKRIANRIGVRHAMVGDNFCDKVLKNDIDGVNMLAADDYDVDAPCHYWGTPLQAAAAKGYDSIVYTMMKYYQADPNLTGGKYHSPLVAAISHGHEDVVQTLLKYGANPLAGAGPFVSPIYQAVSFGDVEMTRAVLERGGWLSDNYGELLDVSSEAGNSELSEILKEYDIRGDHQYNRLGLPEKQGERNNEDRLSGRSHDQSLAEQQLRPRYLPALLQVIRLQGQKGKWTGIKAVKVLQTMFVGDVPERLLDLFRQNINNIQMIIMEMARGKLDPETRSQRPNHTPSEMKAALSSIYFSSLAMRNTKAPSSTSQVKTKSESSESDYTSDEEDSIYCLSCDDRGGRKGTGRLCLECRGTGRVTNYINSDRFEKRPSVICTACDGFGTIFSERDRCRACNVKRREYDETAERRRRDDAVERRRYDESAERRRNDESAERRRNDDAAERRRYDDTAERRRYDEAVEHRRDVYKDRRHLSPPRQYNRDNFSRPEIVHRHSSEEPRSPPPPYPGRR